jgi:PAS domain-containing protein/anti-sigma regulatory factor (Ser/Thr protein kinase)
VDGLSVDARFRRAIDSILDLVVIERAIRDDSGAIVDFLIEWMNNSPVDVAGRPRDELIGHRISELYPALAGGELIAAYRNVVETGTPMIIDVLPYEDVIDGRTVSGFYTVQASRFEDGVLVASRDITDLEMSRRQLQHTLQELESAQRLARLGTWRIDLATGHVEVSKELRRMYAVDGEPTDAASLGAVARQIHPDDIELARTEYQRALRTRQAVVVEHRVVLRDESIVHVRSYIEPVVEGDEVVALWGTTQDITERVVSRNAFAAEHLRRLSAEALAGLASMLGLADDPQVVADAILESLWNADEVAVAVLALLEDDGKILVHYFGGPGVPSELEARYRRTPMTADTPTTRVVRTGAPSIAADPGFAAESFPTMRDDFDTAEVASFISLPLTGATGEMIGALALGWTSPRDLGGDHLAMLQQVAELTARTVERLEVLQLQRSVAQTLQLGLLTLDLRTTAAVVRARYRAADRSMEIGGDWYDAVELDDGRLAVAVGDVVGRGLPAATTMGQLRAALGVASLQATDASDAVRILDRYAQHVPGARCATVAFALIDTRAETVSYLSAGHPPPLLVTPDGQVEYLVDGCSWPLGVETPERRQPAATAAFPAGSLLLLYTDGLIERRREPLEVGLERLRSVMQERWSFPLRGLKQAIFAALVDEAAGDDIALVATRTCGSSSHLFVHAFRAQPGELRGVRHRLADWLGAAGISGEAHDGVLLGVGEALANAVDHGSAETDDIVRVEAAFLEGELVVSVSDSGTWQPGIEGFFSGRGRGHLLMRALASDVDVDTDPNGTIVTLRFARTAQFA